jgi:Lipase (class 3)
MAVFKVDTGALSNLSKSVSDQKQTIEGLSKKYTTLTSHTNKIIDNGPYAIPNAGTVQNTNEAINTGHTNVVKHYSQTIENISSIVIQAKIADFLATSFPPSLDSLNLLKVMKDFISDKLGFLFDGKEKTKEEKLMEETFKTITPEEYGKLAELSYTVYDGDIKNQLQHYGLNNKFEVVKIDDKEITHYGSGLEAVAFKNKQTGEIVVSFRGTQPPKINGKMFSSWENFKTGIKYNGGFVVDVLEDKSAVVGWGSRGTYGSFIQTTSKQLQDGNKYVKKLHSLYGKNFEISFTGHSLGGFVATAVADSQKTKAVTFNAPEFRDGSKAELLKNNNQEVVNFRTDGDAVSKKWEKIPGMKNSPGLTVHVPNIGSSNGLNPHGMGDNFLFDDKGNILVNEGQRNLPKTETIDSSIVSTDTAKELHVKGEKDRGGERAEGKHNLLIEKGKEEALKDLDKAIDEYSKLSNYHSISGQVGEQSKDFDMKKTKDEYKELEEKLGKKIEKAEEKIKDIEKETLKNMKESHEKWESSPGFVSPDVEAQHFVYGKASNYEERQQRRIDKLEKEIDNLQSELKEESKLLDFKVEKGYEGKDSHMMEGLIHRRNDVNNY